MLKSVNIQVYNQSWDQVCNQVSRQVCDQVS